MPVSEICCCICLGLFCFFQVVFQGVKLTVGYYTPVEWQRICSTSVPSSVRHTAKDRKEWWTLGSQAREEWTTWSVAGKSKRSWIKKGSGDEEEANQDREADMIPQIWEVWCRGETTGAPPDLISARMKGSDGWRGSTGHVGPAVRGRGVAHLPTLSNPIYK